MPKDLHEQYNFRNAIQQVVKQVHPDMSITSEALNESNLLIHFLLEKLMTNMNRLVQNDKKMTINSRTVQSAVRLTLPGELSKHAVSEGTKTITKYNAPLASGDQPKVKNMV